MTPDHDPVVFCADNASGAMRSAAVRQRKQRPTPSVLADWINARLHLISESRTLRLTLAGNKVSDEPGLNGAVWKLSCHPFFECGIPLNLSRKGARIRSR